MFERESWFKTLTSGQRDLVREAYNLAEMFKGEEFEDWSFVVFPMAKAYEGFLKNMFLRMGLIDNRTFEGDRFRIGKAINPSMPNRHRDQWWLYDDLELKCGRSLPDKLWRTWKQARNLLFHYFPGQSEAIGLEEARLRLDQIKEAMKALLECKTIKA